MKECAICMFKRVCGIARVSRVLLFKIKAVTDKNLHKEGGQLESFP